VQSPSFNYGKLTAHRCIYRCRGTKVIICSSVFPTILKPRQEDKVTRKTTVERLMDEANKSHKLSGQRMEKIGLCNKTPNGLSLIFRDRICFYAVAF